MTDYSVNARSVKRKVGSTNGTTLAILLVGITLSIVALFGIINTKKGKEVMTAKWDGTSSFVFAINGPKDYLAILQKDPKRIAFLSLGESIPGDSTPEELLKSISNRSGVVVRNYLITTNKGDVVENFEEFSSYITPLKIALGGWDHTSNNISRYDAIRLWWQARNIGTNEISQIDVDNNLSSEDSESILGINTMDINRMLTPYIENLTILKDGLEINVVNASGDARSGNLADVFVSSVGGRVTSINGSINVAEKCVLEGRESYTREYLANTFDCDIKDQVFGEPADSLNFVIGQDFANTYF